MISIYDSSLHGSNDGKRYESRRAGKKESGDRSHALQIDATRYPGQLIAGTEIGWNGLSKLWLGLQR
jgi:hypothetical protein